MPLPVQFKSCLNLPTIVAPMLLASGLELVIACCKAGTIGTFPALSQRSSSGLEQWLTKINAALALHEQRSGKKHL